MEMCLWFASSTMAEGEVCVWWVEVGEVITAGRCVCGSSLYYSLRPCALSILHDENIVKGCHDGPYVSVAASCPSPSCFLSGGGDQARDAGVFRESAFCSLGHARYHRSATTVGAWNADCPMGQWTSPRMCQGREGQSPTLPLSFRM